MTKGDRDAPKDLLTTDRKLNEQIDIAIFGVGHFGASQKDFIDLSRNLIGNKPGDVSSFCQKYRIFLPALINAMARSHPSKVDVGEPADFNDIGETTIRFAIAGNATDAELDKRGWDIGDGVAYVCSDYEMLKRYADLEADDVPTEWTEPDDGDPFVRKVNSLRVYYELVHELISFMDTVASERVSLAVHIDEALV